MRSERHKVTKRRINYREDKRRGMQLKTSRKFKSLFDRDLYAMKQVWEMLKKGTITFIGEVGRQY